MSLTNEDIQLVHSGIKIVAGKCDGAAQLDGSGFNRQDTDFGHNLANLERISELQAMMGVKMIRKYHRQLPEEMVVEFDRILKLIPMDEPKNEIENTLVKQEEVINEAEVTLSNGKKIILNEQQVGALKDIKDWLLSKSELFYTLAGFAGTGKTTIAKEAVKHLRFGVGVSAPTHKAKKVIARSVGRPANTIQSLLGLQPNTDLDNFNINKPQFDSLREPAIGDYDLILIDEASMLNTDLFTLLIQEAANYKTKILFMGDPAQLPPVKEDISQVFVSEKINRTYQLTKVERQADGNPLMLFYDAIRNDISSSIDRFEHKTQVNDKGEGIEFHKDLDPFKARVIDVFTSGEYREDKDYAKLLSWTNEQVKAWNKIIRNAIFTEEGKRVLEIGDLLLSYNSVTGSYGQPLIENSTEFIVKGVREATNEYHIEGYRVALQDLDGFNVNEEIFIVKPQLDNYVRFLAEFNDKLAYAKRVKGGAWREYYHFKERNLLVEDLRDKYKKLIVKKDFDYGYAITVHKSQGSTYNTVFVTENVIDLNPIAEERNKLKYVAFSRPTKLVVSLSQKTIL